MANLIGQEINKAEKETQEYFDAIDHLDTWYEDKLKTIEEQRQEKTLEKDIMVAENIVESLEKIKQVVIQGKNHKLNAPDGTDDGRALRLVDKLIAGLLGILGLSDTGLSPENNVRLTREEHTDFLIYGLDRKITHIKQALDKVKKK